MSESQITIASAVVVPNAHDRNSLSPIQNKRRDSSEQLHSGEAKRARLSIDNDKGRGRRLFGSVLGNLGKSTIDNRAKKRMEVEAKMQEKLKLQSEVAEKESQQKKEQEKLDDRKEWEIQANSVRTANDEAMANFLVTSTRPPLYYLPWKLTSSQESIIARQKSSKTRHRTKSRSRSRTKSASPTSKRPTDTTRSRSPSKSKSRARSRSRSQSQPRSELPQNHDNDVSMTDDKEGEEVRVSPVDQHPVERIDQQHDEEEEQPTKVDMGNDEDVVVEY